MKKDKIIGEEEVKELRGRKFGRMGPSLHGAKFTQDYGRSRESDSEPGVKTSGEERSSPVCMGSVAMTGGLWHSLMAGNQIVGSIGR